MSTPSTNANQKMYFNGKDYLVGEEVTSRSTIDLAAEWLRHEAELLKQGPVSNEVHAHRLQCCTGLTIEGVRVSPPCESFEMDGNPTTGFCQSCRCGERERARLGGDGTKLHCPTYACPRGVWGPMPGTGPQSLGQQAAHITSVIKAAGVEVWNRLFNTPAAPLAPASPAPAPADTTQVMTT